MGANLVVSNGCDVWYEAYALGFLLFLVLGLLARASSESRGDIFFLTSQLDAVTTLLKTTSRAILPSLL